MNTVRTITVFSEDELEAALSSARSTGEAHRQSPAPHQSHTAPPSSERYCESCERFGSHSVFHAVADLANVRTIVVFSEDELEAAVSSARSIGEEPRQSLEASRRLRCAACGASLRQTLVERLASRLKQAILRLSKAWHAMRGRRR